ncbi:MAG TPA: radical SAM protein [Desulfuromonadales bacterium]|nr:radical SAM protein [Desulfuromonadales bacterium]
MSRDFNRRTKELLSSEIHLSPRSRVGQLSFCLVSPTHYRTGMSSLGFQTVYGLLNDSPDIKCERAFLPERDEITEYERSRATLSSFESQRPLADFDVVAFSTSFEPDYLQIPLMLSLAGIPRFSSERGETHPLIIAGGAAFFINPEPVADFMDAICIGEGEVIVPRIVALLLSPDNQGRHGLLNALCRVPGVYVPSRYSPIYDGEQLTGFEVRDGAPLPVARVSACLDRHPPAASRILTDQTEFGDMFLIEVSRGCPRGCRFCSSGFIYGAFRQQSFDRIAGLVDTGLAYRRKIGLVGAAVSDHAEIGRLCRYIVAKGATVSVSSLRIDRIDEDMLDALITSGHKTISLAPEGGSQRLRDLIRKNLTETQILDACDMLISRDILNLKLYVIIGLPTETDHDLDELVRMVETIRLRMIERGRANKRLGELTLSVNPFIPKPFTPFQWCGMEHLPSLERKVRVLQTRLRPLSNVKLKVESLRESYLQALLSRGDRRLALLLSAMADGANLKKAARLSDIDTDRYVYRSIPLDTILPWSIIDTADMGMLRREQENAFAECGQTT